MTKMTVNSFYNSNQNLMQTRYLQMFRRSM